MPRHPRIHVPGALVHIICRGNRRQDIFERPSQWDEFLDSLSGNCRKEGATLCSYCGMPNHLHLQIKVGEVPIDRIFQRTLTKFAARSNHFYGRVGHVFQGRYKSISCSDDVQALATLRYNHRNPVRAGLVSDPADWPWSSHAAYAGLREDRFVDSSFLLSLFAQEQSTARAAYLAFMAQPDPAHGPTTTNVTDLNRLAAEIESYDGLAHGSLIHGGRRREFVRSRDRFIRLAAAAGLPSLQIAEFLGMDRSSVFRAQRR